MAAHTLAERLAADELRGTPARPATVVIFGGAGDLAQRKLLPALYNLLVDGQLPPQTAIVGTGRRAISDDAYRTWARAGLEKFSRRPIDREHWETFASSLFFVRLDLEEPAAFPTLGARLDTVEHERGLAGHRVYYLAVPPSMISTTVRQLARGRFIGPPDRDPYARLIVEKPIGHDLASARDINDQIAAVFDERQIFRIDHYLGKETVQNILVLRFANSFFEPILNQKYVDHVQITVAEAEGVGTRAGYYDEAGALRDMVQNHLLQLLSLVAMEPPHSLAADVVRDERLNLVQSLRPIEGRGIDACVVRACYTEGFEMGRPVPGYLQEDGVNPASRTETYVALQTFIDNWRWAGVPFFLRTGKRLPKRASEISIHLKPVPQILFNTDPANRLDPNVLAIRIQPDEGFALGISSKVPGAGVRIYPVNMNFSYGSTFGASSPEAYERLLLDVLAGDATLFIRRDIVEASWRFVMPILDRWQDPDAPLAGYAAGSWGPAEADRLMAAQGRAWRAL
jgi:glucose-6-phosphate 1-dehydrogenase